MDPRCARLEFIAHSLDVKKGDKVWCGKSLEDLLLVPKWPKQTIVFNSSIELMFLSFPFCINVNDTIAIHMRSTGKHTSLVLVVK